MKKSIIIIILFFSFFLINFQNNNNIKLGVEQYYVINTYEKIGVAVEQIDFNILLFVILDCKTYNEDIDTLLNDFYFESKNEIDEIRNNFLDFLYLNYYKSIRYSSSILFHWYKNKRCDLNEDEIIYNILKKEKLKLKSKEIVDIYSSIIASSMILFSMYAIINKNYMGYNLIAYRPLIKYIIENKDKLIEILHNDRYYKIIKSYFENFIQSFELNHLYNNFCKFYNLQLNDKEEINFYFNFYPSTISNNNQKFQAGMLINNSIYLSGLSNLNILKIIFLHEIAHYYDVKYESFNEIFIERNNFYLLLRNTIRINDLKIKGNKININNLKEKFINLLEEKENIELFKEFVADLSIYNFFYNSDEYNYLLETYKYFINLFIDKENYSYSLESSLYYELIKYIKYKMDLDKINLAEIMFHENIMIRKNLIKNYIKDFIESRLIEILNEGNWIIGEY